MKKTHLEKEIYKKIGSDMQEARRKLNLTRDSFLQEMDGRELQHDKDKDFFSIVYETYKSYENGTRESPVSKFFIIAILLDMDLNNLKKDIQKDFHIEPIEK